MAQAETAANRSFALRCEADGSTTPIGYALRIGRSDECDLVIPRSVVSRRHARIFLRDGAVWIEDQGSTNGTWVNGRRIDAATRLKPGDAVAFDELLYRLVDLADGGGAAVVPFPRAFAPPLRVPARELTETLHGSGSGPVRAVAPLAERETPIHRPSLPAGSSGAIPLPPSPPLLRVLASHRPEPWEVILAAREGNASLLPCLIGLNKASAGQAFLLDTRQGRRQWEIGRDAGAEVSLGHESVSGRHARLMLSSGRWTVVDLVSLNGSFLNGRRISSESLQAGDRLRMGEVEFTFDDGVSPPPGASPEGGGRLARWLAGALRRG